MYLFHRKGEWTNFWSMDPWWIEQSVEGNSSVKPFLFAFMTKSVGIKNDAFIKLRENERRAIPNCQKVYRPHHGLGISRNYSWLKRRVRTAQTDERILLHFDAFGLILKKDEYLTCSPESLKSISCRNFIIALFSRKTPVWVRKTGMRNNLSTIGSWEEGRSLLRKGWSLMATAQ